MNILQNIQPSNGIYIVNILQSYHTSHKKQVFLKEKSKLNTSFSSKHSQIVNYTPLTRQVFNYILNFSGLKFIKLKNKTIADALGCSVRSVIYATNQLQEDGLITKHQENKYAPNYYTLDKSINKNKYTFSHWFNSLSDHNQYLYKEHGITVNDKNKIMFQFEYCIQSINSSLNNNLFINSCSSSSRIRHAHEEFFKNRYPRKGNTMNNFENQFPNMAKAKQKRKNDGGHSPAILKPVLSLEDQIHAKKVDIAFFTKQLENPESFWDPHGILFSANVSMAKSLLARAQFELNELEGVSNEKQSVLHQYQSSGVA